MKGLPDSEKRKFNVVCFTETPLNQLHLLVQEIPGRQINLKPYGLIFNKDFILKKGGHPALYINSYNENLSVRDSIDKIFGSFFGDNNKNQLKEQAYNIIPFLNAMHEEDEEK